MSPWPAAWRASGENIYFQRVAPGEPVSILCLCDGTAALALGSSRQWPAPSPDEPFRFGGCVRPAGLAADVERPADRRRQASLAAAVGLVGLNSFDFLVAGEAFVLIEINPRPGATLDIFENDLLFEAHIDACRGILPPVSLEFTGAAATQIAYARREIAAMPAFDWPAWTADRPRAGERAALV